MAEEILSALQSVGIALTVGSGVLLVSLVIGIGVGKYLKRRNRLDDEWRNRWH